MHPKPIMGKPIVSQSSNGRLVLSWQQPSDSHHMEGLNYLVESCESGSDWRRVKSGIKDASVELPYPQQSLRYRVIVQNHEGMESPASVSVMVRPSRRQEESSSIFSKLEKKYIPNSGDINSPNPLFTARPASRDRRYSSDLSQCSTVSSREISPVVTRGGSASGKDLLFQQRQKQKGSDTVDSITDYRSYKEHPSYKEVDPYISSTLKQYGRSGFSRSRHHRGLTVGDDSLPLYDMSLMSTTVAKLNMTARSIKLTWPRAIRDIQSTYIVEGRAPKKSLLWETYSSGLLATSAVIKGLELDQYDYEFRVRTSNVSGLGEPTSSTSTSSLREKGWEERRNGENVSAITGYTSTESDNFYWDSVKRKDLDSDKSLSELMKAYADGYPIEPRFDAKDSSEQFAVEGRKAKVMCHVYTHSDSDIKWYFNGEKLLMDERYSSNLYPSGLCVLEFSNMSWADAGEYKIRVQNRWGTSHKALQLRVSDPPTFLDVPMKSYQLNRLDSLRVSCSVDGIPFPKVTFYRDWQIIPSASRCVVRQEGPDAHSLTINGVLVKDSGNYQIVAENEAGRIHSTFNVLVEEGTKSDGIVSVKKYLLEDYYYVVEEILREETSSVHKVIEKSTGLAMYARIFTNPSPAVRDAAHQQMLAMQSAIHDSTVKLINVIENSLQVVLLYEIYTTEWLDVLFGYISWTESYVAHCVKELLLIARYLHNANVSLANLQLENILYDKKTSQMKIDMWKAGWLLNSSLRPKHQGPQSMYCAPEVMSGEITLASDAWNIGVIAYILLGGVPTKNCDGGISVDMTTLSGASATAKDFISKLLQRESSERWDAEAALRHRWIKTASELNRGTPLDVASVKAFVSKERGSTALKAPKEDEISQQETDVIKERSKTLEEEAWLVDWFAKYKQDHDTYLIPVRELDMPIRLREYRKHFEGIVFPTSEEEVAEGYENSWLARTLRTRELPGVSEEEVMHVQLTREDFLSLANQGLACIEQQASQASGVSPVAKCNRIFRQKLETTSFKVGEAVTLLCEIEGEGDSCTGFWYRNDELLMGDIEKNTVLVSERFTFSYAKDGKLCLTLKNAVPTDAGVYKCSIRGKDMKSVTTKARLLVGDIPGAPGRPIAAKVWDTHAYIVWSEPTKDGNSTIKRFKVDCKEKGGERWVVCHLTRCCSAIVEGLCSSTVYRFRVSAENDFGYSAYSWASPDTKTLREGMESIVFTPDMNQAVALSLTPPLQEAGAGASGLGLEINLVPPIHSRSNSICDNIEEVIAKSDRAEDLYRFSKEIVHTNGHLYKCKRKDTKRSYLVGVRGHNEAANRELSILKALHHNHIQRLYDLYEQPKHLTLIFQDMSNENILQRLARKATYTERYVVDAMTQIATAVEYLHYRGIIHGVVHPCNIVMSSLHGSRVVLANLSQAKNQDDASSPISSIYSEFLAPEVVMNEGVTKKVDIWGLGLCALVLLSGKSPFYGSTEEDTISRIQYLRFRISSVHPNSSQLAHRFIYNCLKRVAGNRGEASDIVNHPWLDVGNNIQQSADRIVFPSVEFVELSCRLHALKQKLLKFEPIIW
ncbi:obscurin-like isoform X2 [Watersipora subatra]|uniref:obscurin-like isoform X2 n=1 Tax=Watersipora subatra TaxID=2589382 RepID=UPI00355B6671